MDPDSSGVLTCPPPGSLGECSHDTAPHLGRTPIPLLGPTARSCSSSGATGGRHAPPGSHPCCSQSTSLCRTQLPIAQEPGSVLCCGGNNVTALTPLRTRLALRPRLTTSAVSAV
ncbi:hypothetical protein NDU88_002153 [Pleurodeles waltl]|uniref:Uncharacterized protein n=1 Tax=Pleurodeles waltl TaxID=8319 RepID=A0AAV7M355_PLEWA|nr:hypothetical protein NDU88_002153 [Pleurodeles waltl]